MGGGGNQLLLRVFREKLFEEVASEWIAEWNEMVNCMDLGGVSHTE